MFELRYPRVDCARNAQFAVPVIANGKGRVKICEGCLLGCGLAPKIGNGAIMLQARPTDAVISVARNSAFSNNVSIIAMKSVEIGEGCLIGDLVSIMDADGHGIAPSERRDGNANKSAPVKLERNVWLGSRVIILKGVTIGENSIIAPGAVVTSSIPSNCVAGGVPAKVIKTID